jgi:hypothetical protein
VVSRTRSGDIDLWLGKGRKVNSSISDLLVGCLSTPRLVYRSAASGAISKRSSKMMVCPSKFPGKIF